MRTVRITVSDEDERTLLQLAGDADPDAYVQGLVRAHLEAHRDLDDYVPPENLEELLRQGIESGDPRPWNEETKRELRDEILRRVAERRNSKSSI